jgi:hypothetical protein
MLGATDSSAVPNSIVSWRAYEENSSSHAFFAYLSGFFPAGRPCRSAIYGASGAEEFEEEVPETCEEATKTEDAAIAEGYERVEETSLEASMGVDTCLEARRRRRFSKTE